MENSEQGYTYTLQELEDEFYELGYHDELFEARASIKKKKLPVSEPPCVVLRRVTDEEMAALPFRQRIVVLWHEIIAPVIAFMAIGYCAFHIISIWDWLSYGKY